MTLKAWCRRTPHCLRVCYKDWRETVRYAMICKPEYIEINAIHLCSDSLMPQEHPSRVCFALCTAALFQRSSDLNQR